MNLSPLATCEPVLSVVQAAVEPVPTNVSLPESLPLHVWTLYERAVSNLFSRGPQDLGQSNVVEHNINVGDAQPLRPKREEAHKAIRDMKEQGLIEPSNSPWSSPVVLVKNNPSASV